MSGHPTERGLTTRGRSMVAGGLAAAVCALLLDERDLLRVGVSVAALPIIAAILVLGRRSRFTTTHRISPERLSPGVAGTVEVTLTATMRSGPVQLTEQPVAGLTEGMRCILPPLRRGAGVTVRYPLEALRRGRFAVGPTAATVTDPFGLCVTSRIVSDPVQVLVVPTVVPLGPVPSAGGAQSASTGAYLQGMGGGDPDVLVRPYHPGDDIRTIHWRASARRGDLVVRTREPIAHGSATVLIDHRLLAHREVGSAADRQTSSSLETAVSMAASVSAHLLAADYQLRLVSHEGSVIAAGNDIIDDLLVSLADLEPDDGPFRPPRGLGLIVAITGRLDAGEARRLAATKGPGGRGIALLADWFEGTDAAEALAVLRGSGWRAVTISRGADLAALWREACGAGYSAEPSAEPTTESSAETGLPLAASGRRP